MVWLVTMDDMEGWLAYYTLTHAGFEFERVKVYDIRQHGVDLAQAMHGASDVILVGHSRADGTLWTGLHPTGQRRNKRKFESWHAVQQANPGVKIRLYTCFYDFCDQQPWPHTVLLPGWNKDGEPGDFTMNVNQRDTMRAYQKYINWLSPLWTKYRNIFDPRLTSTIQLEYHQQVGRRWERYMCKSSAAIAFRKIALPTSATEKPKGCLSIQNGSDRVADGSFENISSNRR